MMHLSSYIGCLSGKEKEGGGWHRALLPPLVPVCSYALRSSISVSVTQREGFSHLILPLVFPIYQVTNKVRAAFVFVIKLCTYQDRYYFIHQNSPH